jgi:hypothetical protein
MDGDTVPDIKKHAIITISLTQQMEVRNGQEVSCHLSTPLIKAGCRKGAKATLVRRALSSMCVICWGHRAVMVGGQSMHCYHSTIHNQEILTEGHKTRTLKFPPKGPQNI